MKVKLVKESLSPLFENEDDNYYYNELERLERNVLEGKKEVPVRFFYWKEPNMGIGIGETRCYALVPVEAFTVEKVKGMDGRILHFYQLKDEWRPKVGLKTGFDGGWRFDFGDKKRNEEIRKAEKIIKIAKDVKRFK